MQQRSLATVMREFNPDVWPILFFGLPKSSMQKVKDSMSKNAWRDMVQSWKESPMEHAEYYSQQEFIDEARVQENIGNIVLDQPWGSPRGTTVPLEEAMRSAFPETNGDIGAYLTLKRQKADVATQQWMASALEGLI